MKAAPDFSIATHRSNENVGIEQMSHLFEGWAGRGYSLVGPDKGLIFNQNRFKISFRPFGGSNWLDVNPVAKPSDGDFFARKSEFLG